MMGIEFIAALSMVLQGQDVNEAHSFARIMGFLLDASYLLPELLVCCYLLTATGAHENGGAKPVSVFS